MNNSWAILILLTFYLGTGGILGDPNDTTLKPKDIPDTLSNFVLEFHFFGEDLFCSGKVWYDADENVFISDLCSGYWKTMMEQNSDNATQWEKFAPRSKEEFCYKRSGSYFTMLLPFVHALNRSRSHHNYVGKETIKGLETEKWNVATQDRFNFTTNIRYQKSTIDPSKTIAIPVKITLPKAFMEITSFSEEKPDIKSLKAAFAQCSALALNKTMDWRTRYPPEIYSLKHEKNISIPEKVLANLPDSFDWRTQGAVVERDDECQSGVSWACAAAAVVEGAHFLHNSRSKLVRLSKQAIMDCVGSWNIRSKHSTLEDYYAYDWIINNGIPEEDQYPGPNTGWHETCKAGNTKSSVTIGGWGKVSRVKDINKTKAALIHYGPLSMVIDLDKRVVKEFPERIYKKPEGEEGKRQHNMIYSVLIVGYGKENEEEYWIIKPFWGSKYGQKGYIKVSTKYETWITAISGYEFVQFVTF